MSRDILVQDLPADVRSVRDIPDEWAPSPLPCTAADVRAAIEAVATDADFGDPTWVHLERPGVDIEISIRDTGPLESFAFHVRGDDEEAADRIVAAILSRLGLQALDPTGSESGIFEPRT